MPLFDLDEIEAQSGCRARAGLAVYLDGTTGQVAPCIRTPWAPEACRLDESARGLDRVLSHPFFAELRHSRCAEGCWCGADLDAEQRSARARARTFETS
jgi:hypothetical protein